MDYEIISRKDAKEQGLKFYFTGKECKHGMISRRLTCNGNCLCQRCSKNNSERNRERYKLNRESELTRMRRWRENNHEAALQYCRRYYQENKLAFSDRNRRYRSENSEAINEYREKYREDNPDKILARSARQRASKRLAVPPWFSEWDEFVVHEAYTLAIQRNVETAIKWHVDHMIPLRAKKVCGLHCGDNIQVIPAKMNMEKQNKMVLTEPLEWMRY